MKKYILNTHKWNFIFLLTSVVLLGVACEDKDKLRLNLAELEEGINMRVQFQPEFSNLDFANLEAAKIKWDVFTEGSNLKTGYIYASYFNLLNDTTIEDILFKTYNSSDFVNGVINDEELTTQDLISLFDLKSLFQLDNGIEAISGGDIITFRMEAVRSDGVVFPDTALTLGDENHLNVAPGIIASSATSNFTTSYTAFVSCPIPDAANFAVGTYRFSYDPSSAFLFGVPDFKNLGEEEQEITLDFKNAITRTFSIGHLQDFIADHEAEFEILLICGNIIMPLQAGGLACADGLSYETATGDPGTYDETDDSRILIRIKPTGGCGAGANASPLTLILEKLQ